MIVQVSVMQFRHGSAERDKRRGGPRPLLLAVRVRLPEGELTFWGLLTEQTGGRRGAHRKGRPRIA